MQSMETQSSFFAHFAFLTKLRAHFACRIASFFWLPILLSKFCQGLQATLCQSSSTWWNTSSGHSLHVMSTRSWMAWVMLRSPGSRLSGLHLVADTSIRVGAGCIRKLTGLEAVTTVTCLMKYRSLENNAKLPVRQLDSPPSKKICISLPRKSISPSPETPIIVSVIKM